jgi:CTP synthase
MVDVPRDVRYVVVSGGVISGVGKGVVAASLAKILKEHGYHVTLIKIDPYINYDAGTLRPTEHGEVWVTCDGGEIDQDLGNYERFINDDIPKTNSITTGQIYKAVIDRERQGGYLGQTVQFIPHIIDEIVDRVHSAARGYDFAIVEIGGTVGDYENSPFLYAFKTIEQKKGRDVVAHIFVTYLPIPEHINEMKSRPTRQALARLGEHGIIPQFIVCRSSIALDERRKEKIQEFAYLSQECIISAPDTETVYQVPLEFERQNFGKNLLAYFSMSSRKQVEWQPWIDSVGHLLRARQFVKVGIIGKYLWSGDYSITDSYVSIYHALLHAGITHNVGITPVWIDAHTLTSYDECEKKLAELNGIIVPGGFGADGVEGKIRAIQYARTSLMPFLGICYGLQLAVVEYARTICHLPDAHTTEVDELTKNPVIDLLPHQKNLLASNRYGATMRLGVYPATLIQNTRVYTLYKNTSRLQEKKGEMYVLERHRHRYEVNVQYIDLLAGAGLAFSAFYKNEQSIPLVEFIEISDHPFFIATQAHPEFTSRFENAHPLFTGFISAAAPHGSVHP